MSDEQTRLICTHIDVSEILPTISSAKFRFNVSPALKSGLGPAEVVELVIPFQVLISLAHGLPQILKDMDSMGANKEIFKIAGTPH